MEPLICRIFVFFFFLWTLCLWNSSPFCIQQEVIHYLLYIAVWCPIYKCTNVVISSKVVRYLACFLTRAIESNAAVCILGHVSWYMWANVKWSCWTLGHAYCQYSYVMPKVFKVVYHLTLLPATYGGSCGSMSLSTLAAVSHFNFSSSSCPQLHFFDYQ